MPKSDLDDVRRIVGTFIHWQTAGEMDDDGAEFLIRALYDEDEGGERARKILREGMEKVEAMVKGARDAE